MNEHDKYMAFDPDLEYGSAICRSKGDRDVSLKLLHEDVARTLPKGTPYEIIENFDGNFIAWHYHPQLRELKRTKNKRGTHVKYATV